MSKLLAVLVLGLGLMCGVADARHHSSHAAVRGATAGSLDALLTDLEAAVKQLQPPQSSRTDHEVSLEEYPVTFTGSSGPKNGVYITYWGERAKIQFQRTSAMHDYTSGWKICRGRIEMATRGEKTSTRWSFIFAIPSSSTTEVHVLDGSKPPQIVPLFDAIKANGGDSKLQKLQVFVNSGTGAMKLDLKYDGYEFKQDFVDLSPSSSNAHNRPFSHTNVVGGSKPIKQAPEPAPASY